VTIADNQSIVNGNDSIQIHESLRAFILILDNSYIIFYISE
jgi:hypothetical protein